MKKLIIFSLLLTTSAAHAATKPGTTGAQFLKMGAGARPTGMGEAFVGLADDVNAAYYNPAGLGHIDRPEFTAMRNQLFQDMNYDFGAFVYPTNFGAFGITAATLKVEDLQKRGIDESFQGTFKSMDEAYGLSFAKNMGPLTSIGITARYIKQELDTESATSWNGDIGILQKIGKTPNSVGLAIRHFGQKIKFRSESDPQPSVIDFGISRGMMKDKLIFAANAKKPKDNGVQFGVGSEMRIPLKGALTLLGRVGYNSSTTGAEDASGLSVGGGIELNRLSIDFAWVPQGILGDSFRYSLRMRF
jgi:hypothetical protein